MAKCQAQTLRTVNQNASMTTNARPLNTDKENVCFSRQANLLHQTVDRSFPRKNVEVKNLKATDNRGVS